MSDSPREIARSIKSEHSALNDVSLDEITVQVRALQSAGMSDEQLKKVVPTMFELKATVEQRISEEFPPAPKEIRIHSLPEELQREDWS